MLSDEQTQRVGDSYRRGYRDGYAGRRKREDPDIKPSPGLDPWRPGERPFVGFDYSEGYRAGAIDAKADRQKSSSQRPRPETDYQRHIQKALRLLGGRDESK